jgi:DNA-binding CsgD family transcriptional regulator
MSRTRPVTRLSSREEQILTLLCRGMSYKFISAEIGIGNATVRQFLARARTKLKAENTAHLTAIFTEMNLREEFGNRLSSAEQLKSTLQELLKVMGIHAGVGKRNR